VNDTAETSRIADNLARLRAIRDNDPEGILRRAAEAARAHEDELVQSLAPVFEQWAFRVSFDVEQSIIVGSPEIIAVARKLLEGEDQ